LDALQAVIGFGHRIVGGWLERHGDGVTPIQEPPGANAEAATAAAFWRVAEQRRGRRNRLERLAVREVRGVQTQPFRDSLDGSRAASWRLA